MGKKSYYRVFAVVMSFVLSGCLQYIAPEAKIPRVTKEDLKLMLDRPDVIIVVDVRIEDEWKKSEWKIKGSIREDPGKDIQSWIEEYPKDKTLVFY